MDVRSHFPIFSHQPALVYLDSSATALKPHAVIDAEMEYYKLYPANIHRGLYELSLQASDMYEQARETVARFLHARSNREIVFTKGTTESLNLLAATLPEYLKLDNTHKIIVSSVEHHANLLPWQQVAQKTEAKLEIIPLDTNFLHDLDALERMLDVHVQIVSLAHVSNVLGLIFPVEKAVALIRQKSPNAIIILDAAQSVSHIPIDVQFLGIDALAFSGHKLFGPTGIGVLWARQELLQELPAYQTGGGMVARSTYQTAEFHPAPDKFEAGTPPIAQVIGLGAAIDWIEELGGVKAIHEQMMPLTKYLLDSLQTVPELQILGNLAPENRVGVATFTLPITHPHDVAQVLGDQQICVRAGHHCAMPLHQALSCSASTRASLQVYNTREDVDKLTATLKQIVEMFK